MKRILSVALLVISIPTFADDVESDLVGTWKLVRFENIDGGVSEHPFGENPIGYFIYTSDGRVSIHIQEAEVPAEWRSLKVPPDEGQPEPWYVGYFGRYSVDAEAGTVTHHVEGGTLLAYPGTDQVRPFVLEGDRLLIGVEGEWERELQRVR